MVEATKSAGCVPRFVKSGPADLPRSWQEYGYVAAVATTRTEGSNSQGHVTAQYCSSASLLYTPHTYSALVVADNSRHCIT